MTLGAMNAMMATESQEMAVVIHAQLSFKALLVMRNQHHLNVMRNEEMASIWDTMSEKMVIR